MRHSKKIKCVTTLAITAVLVVSSKIESRAAFLDIREARSQMRMYDAPEFDANQIGVIRTGERIINFGIDFNEGNTDFDHVYRQVTNQFGYVDHHDW